MLSTIRNYVLAVGAAALLSGQAAYAAPVQVAPTADPLVALSLLGSAQSRAAVCGKGANCGLPVTTGASAAAMSPDVSTTAAAAALQGSLGQQRSEGLLFALAIGAAMVLTTVLVVLLTGDPDDDEPISPA